MADQDVFKFDVVVDKVKIVKSLYSFDELDHEFEAGRDTEFRHWTLLHQVSDVWSKCIDDEFSCLVSLFVRNQFWKTFNGVAIFFQLE